MNRAISPNQLPDVGLFHDDPNQSYTLPGIYYYDDAVYQQELKEVFNRSWQYVCHVGSLTSPGDYAVRDIGDQSVAVIRDQHGKVKAHHNVCRHRAHRLLEGVGKTGSAIVCPYHNWTYDLSGELKFARHSDEVSNFNHSDFCLSSVRVETFCGFVFVNLDAEADPLLDGLDELEWEIRELSPNIDNLKRAYYREIPIAANWKNSVENYSECYHCPNQHPGLANGSLDMNSYQITVHGKFHSHASCGVGENTAYAKERDGKQGEREFGSWLLWPNFVLEVYPGGYLNVFHHLPDGPEKTIQICEWYFPSKIPTQEQQGIVDFVDGVRNEDIPICETVQKGLHSDGYTQGRFIANPDRSYFSEHAVHDFQKKVLVALGKWGA
jgi:phenylpropionate dioxygenase-like ring-hydroxylating dioxygenase large terminal subunit